MAGIDLRGLGLGLAIAECQAASTTKPAGLRRCIGNRARPSYERQQRMEKLRQRSERLELLRLAEEDTFCHDSMTSAERKWLREHRCPTAAHWNILTDITAANLAATVIKG